MNFLAHLYLSGSNPKLMVGNFIGDFVKGRTMVQQFEPEIIKGIELHRAIDAFTDTHPVVTQSKNRLRPMYRHYAPVIVDVFYDYYLARNWHLYHTVELSAFAVQAYTTLQFHHAILPERVQQMLPYMINGNWLVNYARVEGIQRALTGMSRRTTYISKMDEAINELRKYHDEFEEEFLTFFPQLIDHANNF
mgnify:CR=1 FL=1